MNENQVVAVVFQPPTNLAEVQAGLAEEMQGLEIEFDRVKIPSGGGVAFEVPGDNPDSPDVAKELVGVIVDHHPVNARWESKFDGQSNPPVCSSMDGMVGVGIPGGNCKTCPYNQYGSDDEGSGKGCKNMHRVYILRDGDVFPMLVTLPPTSIKPFSGFLAKRVLTKGHRSYGVVTKITLKKEKSKTGIEYAEAQFAVTGKLEPEHVEQMRVYSESIKSATRKVEIMSDFMTTGDSSYDFSPEIQGIDNDVPF